MDGARAGWLVSLALVTCLGCRSEVTRADHAPEGKGSGGAGDGVSSSRDAFPTGDCESSRECAGALRCLELTEGGYRICEEGRRWVEATHCDKEYEQCCDTSDCTPGATCAREREDWRNCTDAVVPRQNYCVDLGDACTTDDDCITEWGPGICAPDGAFGGNGKRCRRATCRKHSDCNAQPGGVCGPVQSQCSCGKRSTITCIYPGGCMYHDDCPVGFVCQPRLSLGYSVCSVDDGEPCF